jgi:hypothetical protein
MTGLSRQAVCIALGKLVDNGELIRVNAGRSLRYRRAVARRFFSSLIPEKFWALIAKECPSLHYVRVATTCGRRDRRKDAHAAWRNYANQKQVILDFDGVDDATLPFLCALVFELPLSLGQEVLPINLHQTLRPKLAQAERAHARGGDLLNERYT